MKLAVFYDSVTGNTKQAAEWIAEGMCEAAGVEARVFSIEDVDEAYVAEIRGAVIGCPSYMAWLTPNMRTWLMKAAKLGLAGKLGGGGKSEDMPTTELAASDLTDGVADIMTLLVRTGLCPSKSDARRNIQQGGITANDEKITDISRSFSAAELKEGVILRRGKKSYQKVILK